MNPRDCQHEWDTLFSSVGRDSSQQIRLCGKCGALMVTRTTEYGPRSRTTTSIFFPDQPESV